MKKILVCVLLLSTSFIALSFEPKNKFDELALVCKSMSQLLELWLPLKELEIKQIIEANGLDENQMEVQAIFKNTRQKMKQFEEDMAYCSYDESTFPSDGLLRKIYRIFSLNANQMTHLLLEADSDEEVVTGKIDYIQRSYVGHLKKTFSQDFPNSP